jgi:hypothetical protein
VNKAITSIGYTVRRFLAAILLLGVAAHGGGGETNSLLVGEKLGIDKIAQLTAREHSEILFTLADYAIGYAREGHIQWINPLKYQGGMCGWPHPALAHDGVRVAFVSSSDVPRYCRITLHDVSTGTEQPRSTLHRGIRVKSHGHGTTRKSPFSTMESKQFRFAMEAKELFCRLQC